MRSGSPLLDPKYFERLEDGQSAGWAAPGGSTAASPVIDTGDRLTVRGTAWATATLFALLLVTAFIGWTSVDQTSRFVRGANGQLVETTTVSPPGWLLPALLVAFGVAIFTAFKPNVARFTAPVFALLEGLVLGAISALFEFQYDGIVLQAVLGTFGVFLGMLAMYGLGIIKVTDNFRRIIMGAMIGIFVMYGAGFLFSLFGTDIRFWNQPTPLGIGISFVIVGVAAFSLALDFDFIERAAEAGVPRRTEWFAAFGLLVGLVWLYLEILRLLALLRER